MLTTHHKHLAGPESREAEPWGALRRFAQPRIALERCELCSLELSAEHQHLVEPATRQLLCACDACALLFGQQGDAKYRRVPRQARYLPDFRLTDLQWNGLAIPIGLAFFFTSSPLQKVVAIYPSPAGPTESQLDFDSWGELVGENPVLKTIEPDAEALLVNRVGPSREYYLAPLDACYQLVGLLRLHWRGLSGGAGVWREIEQFFADLNRRSQTIRDEGDRA